MSRWKQANTIRCSRFSDSRVLHRQAGLTLIELMVAVTISGLVAAGALFAFRIGTHAWQKAQQSAIQLRKTTGIEDAVELQLSDLALLSVRVELFNRTLDLPFFFGEQNRAVFTTSYSVRARGRGGLVVADYFAEQQPDGTWSLWLDERPMLDAATLASFVAGVERRQDNLEYPVLRQFDKRNALPLWNGLRECSFRYYGPTAQAQVFAWFPVWTVLAANSLPKAVLLQPAAERDKWAGMLPTPISVPLRGIGVSR